MVLRLSIVLLIVASIQAVPVIEFEREWTQFLTEFHPKYKDLAELEYRKQIFRAQIEEINKHNAEYDLGLHTYRKGINQFSDKTKEEKRQLGVGFKWFSIRDHIRPNEIFELKPNMDIPESIDWRSRGAVTPIKDQRHCKSCWAFSAIGAIEGQYFLATNKSVSFSEQELVDCSRSNSGCRHGGDMERAYVDLRKLGGVATAHSYPYEGEEGECRYKEKMAVAEVAGYVGVAQNEEALKQAVALHGPISAGVEATSNFHDYTGGILHDVLCSHYGQRMNHGVLVVGYGSENGSDYWIVKNSWGKLFGERGYIRMARNRNNTCQIATLASFPLVRAVNP